jgi:hypothetical protein
MRSWENWVKKSESKTITWDNSECQNPLEPTCKEDVPCGTYDPHQASLFFVIWNTRDVRIMLIWSWRDVLWNKNETKETVDKLTNAIAETHTLIHSAIFATGDKFLDEPRSVITDMLTLRLRPMRFQPLMTRFVRHAVHSVLSCSVWPCLTHSQDFESFETYSCGYMIRRLLHDAVST